MKDFYDALATYMYVHVCVACAWLAQGLGGATDDGPVLPGMVDRSTHTQHNPPPHRDVYGSKEVPEDFTVPFDASSSGGRWPERMQGLRLGKYFKKLVTEAVSA